MTLSVPKRSGSNKQTPLFFASSFAGRCETSNGFDERGTRAEVIFRTNPEPMPKITFNNQTIQCETGDNLRHVLMRANLPLYNGVARLIHCRGLGTCGTCAVRLKGEVSPMTGVEKWRLGFPPHRQTDSLENGLRLACQCKVLGDLEIEKLTGMWGNVPPES